MIRHASLVALAVVSCAERPARVADDDGWGPSDRHGLHGELLAPAPRASAIPIARRVRWRHADWAGDLERVKGRARSEHGAGAFERTVRINARAQSYLALPGSGPMPEGAVLLQDHHPTGVDQVEMTFAMAKLAPGTSPQTRDYSFAVLDGELREAAGGDLSLCPRCHLEAPHDGLFGPPAATAE